MALFGLAAELSIRPVEFLKLTELLIECALNEELSIQQILEDDPFKQILKDDETNRNQKIIQLKDAVYVRRFPVISQYRREMEMLDKEFHTPVFKVNYDKTFERSGLQLNAIIKNENDIKKLCEALSKSENTEIIIKMLKRI